MQALGEKGIKAYTPLVPTLNIITNDVTKNGDPIFDTAEPAEGWPQAVGDAAAVEEDVVALINQGRKIIIIAHSNGGFAGTQAARPEYHFHTRAKEGLSGGLIGILYVSAYLLPIGVAVNEVVGKATLLPLPNYTNMQKLVSVHPFACVSFSLLASVRKMQVTTPDSCGHSLFPDQKLNNDPYKTYPLGYVVCQEDLALVPEAQEYMIDAQVQQGADIKIYREPSDHCPTLSAIDRLVEIV